MEIRELKSWDEFLPCIKEIRDPYEKTRHSSEVLFRGQGDSNWELQTTLERVGRTRCRLLDYMQSTCKAVDEIQSELGKQFDTLGYLKYRDELLVDTRPNFLSLPDYHFLVYLRHHGFASPLLDWSRSPIVAAYFAFMDSHSDEGHVAIFVYIERPKGVKMSDFSLGTIDVIGPYVTADSRHFKQQARYTVCTTWKPGDSYTFERHEDVFVQGHSDQDLLVKVTIPRSERLNALAFFEDVNMNGYQLFHSEDSLVASLSLRIFDLNQLAETGGKS